MHPFRYVWWSLQSSARESAIAGHRPKSAPIFISTPTAAWAGMMDRNHAAIGPGATSSRCRHYHGDNHVTRRTNDVGEPSRVEFGKLFCEARQLGVLYRCAGMAAYTANFRRLSCFSSLAQKMLDMSEATTRIAYLLHVGGPQGPFRGRHPRYKCPNQRGMLNGNLSEMLSKSSNSQNTPFHQNISIYLYSQIGKLVLQ